MSDLAISTRGLSRVFHTSAGELRALDDLNLEIERGQIFGFLGPNGAGKTTTVRLLLGLVEPTDGNATVFGIELGADDARIRERSGALLEHDGLYERLTAYENLDFQARAWRFPAAERRRRIAAQLERFGLWERREDAVGSWSRGMKRKLALARALLHDPELVFLDEPTAGLDPGAAAALRDDLAQLAAEKRTTIFLNTHNLAEAEKLCDLIGVITKGRLRAVGSPAELRRQMKSERLEIIGTGFEPRWQEELHAVPGVQQATIRESHIDATLDPGSSAAELVRFVVERGGQIEEVHRGAASLEDVYLQMTDPRKAEPAAPSPERAQ